MQAKDVGFCRNMEYVARGERLNDCRWPMRRGKTLESSLAKASENICKSGISIAISLCQ